MQSVRLTDEEIKNSITQEMLEKAMVASKSEPDMTDPDAPDFSELLIEEVKRRGRPKKTETKKSINVRFSTDVLAAMRRLGRGWQTRIDDVMREWLSTHGLL